MKDSQADVLQKGRVVKNPGSRGGIGYWDGNGNWHYGQRPVHPRGPRQQSPPAPTQQGGPAPSPHRARLRDALKGLLTSSSPTIEQSKQRLQEHGYIIKEDAGLLAKPTKEREQTLKNVEEAVSFVHDTIPGLSDLVNAQKLSLTINTTPVKGPDISGKYSVNPLTKKKGITIRQDAGQTFFHEIGHFIDNSLPGGQDEKILGMGLPFASQRKGSSAQKIVASLQSKRSVHTFLDEGEKKNGEMYRDYLSQEPEMFARAFNAYLDHEYSKKAGGHVVGERIGETFTPQELDRIGTQMTSLLKQAHYKSFRDFLEVLEKSRIVKNPGSRGGVGYWNNGKWYYGHPPMGRTRRPTPPERESRPTRRSTTSPNKRRGPTAQQKRERTVKIARAVAISALLAASAYSAHSDSQQREQRESEQREYRERSEQARKEGQRQQREENKRHANAKRYTTTEEWEKGTAAQRAMMVAVWNSIPQGAFDTIDDTHAEALRKLQKMMDEVNASAPKGAKPVTIATLIRDARRQAARKSFRDYCDGLTKLARVQDFLTKSRAVQHPGSRGGHYWVDQHGQVRYGTPPAGEDREHALAVLRERVTTSLLSNNVRWAFLTAFHKSRSHVQNLKLNAQLFKDLHAHGARVLSCTGFYTYHDDQGKQQTTKEPTFLALGLGPHAAIALGHKYDQESVLSDEGFFECNAPQRTPITSKRVLDGEIEKNTDQPVIYLPDRNLTFLVDGAWDSPQEVPDNSGLYPHLRGDVAKSFGAGEGGYTAPAPPTSSLALIAAQINLESAL